MCGQVFNYAESNLYWPVASEIGIYYSNIIRLQQTLSMHTNLSYENHTMKHTYPLVSDLLGSYTLAVGEKLKLIYISHHAYSIQFRISCWSDACVLF